MGRESACWLVWVKDRRRYWLEACRRRHRRTRPIEKRWLPKATERTASPVVLLLRQVPTLRAFSDRVGLLTFEAHVQAAQEYAGGYECVGVGAVGV